MSFADLHLIPQILRAIADCGYTEPTPVQCQAIPEALTGRDVLASARTGTGKTAAFVLPSLQRLATPRQTPPGAPRVLVLTPTRELAAQITDATRRYGSFLRLRSAVILGGMPYAPQLRDLSRSIDMVVGTPGRLVDHLQRGTLDLSHLEVLILDEADRMLDMGFKQDLDKVTAATPSGRQTLLFTATLDKTVADLAGRLLRDPVRVQIDGRQMTPEHIRQHLHMADSREHKQRLLQHLAADVDLTRAIVFSATKRGADRLARDLSAQGHQASALHGDMNQSARNRTVRDLRNGRIRLLVATDVAARGLDVAGISHVINFDLPLTAEDYVHRVGRTGRAGASGIAISFAGRDESNLVRQIEGYLGKRLPQEVIPGLEPVLPPMPAGSRSGAPRNRKPSGETYRGRGRNGAASFPGRRSSRPVGASGAQGEERRTR